MATFDSAEPDAAAAAESPLGRAAASDPDEARGPRAMQPSFDFETGEPLVAVGAVELRLSRLSGCLSWLLATARDHQQRLHRLEIACGDSDASTLSAAADPGKGLATAGHKSAHAHATEKLGSSCEDLLLSMDVSTLRHEVTALSNELKERMGGIDSRLHSQIAAATNTLREQLSRLAESLAGQIQALDARCAETESALEEARASMAASDALTATTTATGGFVASASSQCEGQTSAASEAPDHLQASAPVDVRDVQSRTDAAVEGSLVSGSTHREERVDAAAEAPESLQVEAVMQDITRLHEALQAEAAARAELRSSLEETQQRQGEMQSESHRALDGLRQELLEITQRMLPAADSPGVAEPVAARGAEGPGDEKSVGQFASHSAAANTRETGGAEAFAEEADSADAREIYNGTGAPRVIIRQGNDNEAIASLQERLSQIEAMLRESATRAAEASSSSATGDDRAALPEEHATHGAALRVEAGDSALERHGANADLDNGLALLQGRVDHLDNVLQGLLARESQGAAHSAAESVPAGSTGAAPESEGAPARGVPVVASTSTSAVPRGGQSEGQREEKTGAEEDSPCMRDREELRPEGEELSRLMTALDALSQRVNKVEERAREQGEGRAGSKRSIATEDLPGPSWSDVQSELERFRKLFEFVQGVLPKDVGDAMSFFNKAASERPKAAVPTLGPTTDIEVCRSQLQEEMRTQGTQLRHEIENLSHIIKAMQREQEQTKSRTADLAGKMSRVEQMSGQPGAGDAAEGAPSSPVCAEPAPIVSSPANTDMSHLMHAGVGTPLPFATKRNLQSAVDDVKEDVRNWLDVLHANLVNVLQRKADADQLANLAAQLAQLSGIEGEGIAAFAKRALIGKCASCDATFNVDPKRVQKPMPVGLKVPWPSPSPIKASANTAIRPALAAFVQQPRGNLPKLQDQRGYKDFPKGKVMRHTASEPGQAASRCSSASA